MSQSSRRLWKSAPMSVAEVETNIAERAPSRMKRPRSAVTSGRKLFVEGNPNSAWSRRYYDLCAHHIHDISCGEGRDALTAAQLSLIKRASSIECELERLDAMLSMGVEVSLLEYGRAASHLRRLFETLGIERKPPRDVTPTLGEIAAEIEDEKRSVEDDAA
jgi:hypothetical protein